MLSPREMTDDQLKRLLNSSRRLVQQQNASTIGTNNLLGELRAHRRIVGDMVQLGHISMEEVERLVTRSIQRIDQEHAEEHPDEDLHKLITDIEAEIERRSH